MSVLKSLPFAVRVLVDAVEFVVEIAGIVKRCVVRNVGPLVRSVANFLRDHLGLDMTGLLNWLALMFDTEMIKETQLKLTDFVKALRNNTHTFFEVNEGTLKDSFEALRKKLEPIIKDDRPKHDASKSKDNPVLKVLGWLLDNPILETIRKYSPVFWILDAEEEGIMEGLGNSLQVPDCSILFRTMEEVAKSILDENIVNIWDLLVEVWEGIKSILDDPSKVSTQVQTILFDAFWTIFDAAKSIIVGIYKAVAGVVEQFFEVLTGEWKVPLLTAAFKAWADQSYSFLNLATYGLAQVMHIFFPAVFKKKPFEVLGDPSGLFDGWTRDTLDLHDFFGVPRQDNNSTILMTAAPGVVPHTMLLNNAAAVGPSDNFDIGIANVDPVATDPRYRVSIPSELISRVSKND